MMKCEQQKTGPFLQTTRRFCLWIMAICTVLILPFQVQTSYATNGTFTATGSMTVSRGESLTASRIQNGKVLVTGGTNRTTVFNTAELYDPQTGKFTQTGSMSVARHVHVATVLINGKVLISGGATTYNGTSTNIAEVYDPATGTFSTVGKMNSARYGHSATLLSDGKVLIAGGFYSTGPTELDSVELYDPVTDTFTLVGKMSQKKGAHTATLLKNGKVLIAGGAAYGAPYAVAELFDPSTQQFTIIGSLSQTRWAHSAVLLNDGMVLILGGIDNIATAELYDPATGVFQLTANMNKGGHSRIATLLSDGNVLVSGGTFHSSVWEAIQSAEIYNTGTKTFTTIGNMVNPRSSHASVALNDGSVLLVGGFSGDNGANTLATAELFTYSTPAACGAANLTTITAAPTTDFCSSGTASAVTGTGPWYWTCDGINGGSPAICSAYLSPTPVDPTTTKSKLYMGADGDRFTASNSGITIYGGSGTDIVTIADGITNVVIDQNVERVNFSGAVGNYAFKQTGNKINIYNAAGTTLLASVPVQGDTDGTLLGFSDGRTSVVLSNAVITVGGKIVSTGTPTALAPTLTP